MSSRRANSIHLALSLSLTLFTVALVATAGVRVRFTPKFMRGEVLRYRVESRTTTKGTTTTPIVNPEGGSQSTQTIHMVVRLDAIGASPGGQVRFRATYEKSSAESESDALDLAASTFADQYDRLEGHSVEFTRQPSGEFTDLQIAGGAGVGRPGAGDPASSQSAFEPALALVQGLFFGGDVPQKGVVIGQKWTTERPIPGAVLSSLISRAESSYLRNEPCGSFEQSNASGIPSAAHPDDCAVILTQFKILRRGSTNSDATPDEYRRNGLRTSGTWTGSGESLDSISPATGLLVSSTRTSTQNMDYQITSASTGSSIHHVGKVENQSEITLLPGPP